jgi:uncharacterized protein (TIGR00730 family)
MPKKKSVKAPSRKSSARRRISQEGARRLAADSRMKRPSPAENRFKQWLCDPQYPCEPMPEQLESFTENPNWRIFRIMAEFIEGFEFLDKFHGEVTIFGSARAQVEDEYYQKAKELGYLLGKEGYTVITGGGPGIMEAANWGAYEAGGESVGLDIELPSEQRRNQYVTRALGFHYFFTRKVMLSASAQAYVFFPGGFGTLDEMSEMIVLTQTGKIPPNVPSILIGKKFWHPLVEWVSDSLYGEHRYISKKDIGLLHVVDTPKEALKIIKKTKERPYGSERTRVFKGFRSSAK